MKSQRPKLHVEKELSWLSFNERVLQEAADKSVPIVERVRFLGIFSNNLDEFFRVRVANVRRRILIEKEKSKREKTKELLSAIQNKVLKLQKDFDDIYMEIIIGLARHNIFLINDTQLSESHGRWLRKYFRDNILPHIAPIIVTNSIDLAQVLKDDLTYLVIALKSQDKVEYALIEVPSDRVSRFVNLPHEKGRKKKSMILLDNIIRYCLDDIFQGFFEYDSATAYSMKMTRDADFDLSEDVDLSILEQMSDGLKQRLTGKPVRFVHDREMPDSMIEFIKYKLGIVSYDSVIPGGRYHNFKDFIGFPNVGRAYLENKKLRALDCADFDRHTHSFEAISAKDILLYYPYHKFRYFTDFLRQAAFDPAVKTIKISIYRVATKSQVIKSLIDAAENGKQVTVIVELRARFDEEANIDWARELTESGVKVDFGVPSLKCHTKLCQVARLEGNELAYYSHVGTGNFHEKTARIYTDFSLFTKNPEINEEVINAFDFIQNAYKRYRFKHLIISPNDTRRRIYKLIDQEIEFANQNKKSEIFIKVNNLVDTGLVNKLYAASNAGVKIRMIIRGMCSLVPGVPGHSQNIQAISIVDRFLEHPRVFAFHAGGRRDVFISSADWMTRNIDHRVEVGCPIYDETHKKTILGIMELQWSDRAKARVIDKEQTNPYNPRGNRKKIRSQIVIHDYLKSIEEKSKNRGKQSDS
ncbi:polyphosphate kinase 1 [Echinimonas agarilytica]|uniref:Polyphosphate kinase n=1 Tax=Echinimonas agarilytica TaxID=1215918 RepID=A0AA41W6Z4_9GAMM|nr:polyphosphate kinase 1 [Echinimonas agarilytica]MCM2680172.1 polyphosphate kinase 1 [Echinimonas agarilytica]